MTYRNNKEGGIYTDYDRIMFSCYFPNITKDPLINIIVLRIVSIQQHMSMKLQDFICFLYNNKMINIHNLLKDDENGFINRLKLQKYVFLAQSSLQNNFGYEYNIYRNGPYSPELANYYYEELDLNSITSNVKEKKWTENVIFTDRFLKLFKDKEHDWLEVSATLIDSINYSENEQESLNKVYAIKSRYSRDYIDNIWDELKGKGLVHYESNLKSKNFLSIF
jgi:uncharacterized protein YwgA